MREDISWSDIKTKSPPKRRKRKSSKKKKIKGGYVYLFERISLRSLASILTGQREIKIGITEREDVKDRLKEVDRAIVGKVIKIHHQWYENPLKEEKRLHDIFESEKFRPKAVRPGGGQSEWFRMSKSEFRQLRREFSISRGWYAATLLYGSAIIILYVVYLILRVWLTQ